MAASTIKIIDSHVHILQPSRFHYHWLEAGSSLDRNFELADVGEEMKAFRVVGGILMEATNTPEEIPYLLEIGESADLNWGVIGWIHLEKADAADQIAQFAAYPCFKGIRLNWLRSRQITSALHAAMKTIEAQSLVVDVLASWDYLPEIAAFVSTYPNVSFVLEHLGGVPMTEALFSTWQTLMKPFVALPNVAVKISGYSATNAAPPAETPLYTYVHDAVEIFGSQRLMFGSNYPICLNAASYADTVAYLDEVTSDLGENERQALFYETARQIYHLL